MSTFETDIRFLKGVGEKRAQYLNALGIDNIGALLRYYPRGYEDFKNITPIWDTAAGEKACIKGRIATPINEIFIRKNMTIYKFVVEDESGRINITVFNNKYLAKSLHTGNEYLFSGKVEYDRFGLNMSSPEIRTTEGAGLTPIYRAGKNMSSAAIEKLVKTALSSVEIENVLPDNIRSIYRLCDLKTALEEIHFPKSEESLKAAKQHLVFEELFILQTGLMLLKNKRRTVANVVIKKDYTDEFFGLLPFSPTSAQKRVIKEAIADMASGRVMNRLIQGDVGSGKTAVAAALMYVTAKSGYQSVLMAPTEILAEQHFKSLSAFFKDTDIKCVLVTGSLKKGEKTAAKKTICEGECQIAVGTHALLTDDVSFKNLALVITDEQHRFGVSQRAALAAKGENTHTLVMSATPIPRTLGLIIYGDLDISIIDEYPKGRIPIENYCVASKLRPRVYAYIKKHLDQGRQGYIVCPMVEESDEISLNSAQEYYSRIKDNEFNDYSVGLLHGQMKAAEKERIMRAFKAGEIQLLVCTTVIEVGIDVPNAAIMVIENAERFGLSTLHQLRGRIGRGRYKSSCIFISDFNTGTTAQRLRVIKDNNDGFKIADEDLRLRGPGDFLGSRQHGLPELKIADLYADTDTLRIARMAAAALLENDPRLKKQENIYLRKEIISLYKRLNEN